MIRLRDEDCEQVACFTVSVSPRHQLPSCADGRVKDEAGIMPPARFSLGTGYKVADHRPRSVDTHCCNVGCTL